MTVQLDLGEETERMEPMWGWRIHGLGRGGREMSFLTKWYTPQKLEGKYYLYTSIT